MHFHFHVTSNATFVGSSDGSAAATAPYVGTAIPPPYRAQPEDEPGPGVPHVDARAQAAAGPPPRPPAHGAGSAPADIRVYAVWHIPGHPEATGIWVGHHPACWDAICDRLRGRQYAGSGANLRRYASVAEAQAAWTVAAPRAHRPAATPARVFEVYNPPRP